MRKAGIALSIFLFAQWIVPGQDPMSPEAKKAWDQGYELTRSEDYKGALAAYEKGVSLSPRAAEIWAEYALCLRKVNRLASSVKAGWWAIKLAPGVWDPWNNQANTFMGNRNWEAAFYCLGKTEALNPDKAMVCRQYLALAYRLWKDRRMDEALRAVERAQSIDPTNGMSYVDKGAMIFCRDKSKKKEAKALIEKGIEIFKRKEQNDKLTYAYGNMDKIDHDIQWFPKWEPELSYQRIPEELFKEPSEGALAAVTVSPTAERVFELNEGDLLSMKTPEPWWESQGRNESFFLFTCQYRSLNDQRFLCMMSPRFEKEGDPELRREAELKAEGAKENAEEKEIPLVEFTSPTAKGYYFIVKDKTYDPKKAGDFPIMLSATARSGSLRFHVTVLMDSREEKAIGAFVDVLKSLTYLPKSR
jgi:tetratricopeptide (TPR) repeat protein